MCSYRMKVEEEEEETKAVVVVVVVEVEVVLIYWACKNGFGAKIPGRINAASCRAHYSIGAETLSWP